MSSNGFYIVEYFNTVLKKQRGQVKGEIRLNNIDIDCLEQLHKNPYLFICMHVFFSLLPLVGE